ncbi:helix-turn-helix domain-containing protein [candidate division KSB1 bacterium]|nr:helix-turn-helix domain-containing protein [candidate division KSB1 bacterium]
MTKKILNLTDLAQYVGVSKRTIYNMLKDKRFPVRPIPKSNPRKWSAADVDSWMAGKYE